MTDVAVVTGTSTGMGLHAAVELARRGLTVVATMRDPARAGALQDAARDAGTQLGVNYLGPVALTQAVLPAMRGAAGGGSSPSPASGERSGSRSRMRTAAPSSPSRASCSPWP